MSLLNRDPIIVVDWMHDTLDAPDNWPDRLREQGAELANEWPRPIDVRIRVLNNHSAVYIHERGGPRPRVSREKLLGTVRLHPDETLREHLWEVESLLYHMTVSLNPAD